MIINPIEIWMVEVVATCLEAKQELKEMMNVSHDITPTSQFSIVYGFGPDRGAAKRLASQWEIRNKKQFGALSRFRIRIWDMASECVVKEQGKE